MKYLFIIFVCVSTFTAGNVMDDPVKLYNIYKNNMPKIQNKQKIELAKSTILSLNSFIDQYVNMESQGIVPQNVTELKSIILKSENFKWDILNSNLCELGYMGINNKEGYSYIIVGRGKDINKTYFWVTENNSGNNCESDKENFSGIPCTIIFSGGKQDITPIMSYAKFYEEYLQEQKKERERMEYLKVKVAGNTLVGLKKAIDTYINMDSNGVVPETIADLKKMFLDTGYFRWSDLSVYMIEIGYVGINHKGQSAQYIIVGRAKDKNKTYVWLNESITFPKTDLSNMSGIECSPAGL